MSQADVEFLGLQVDAAARRASLAIEPRHCTPFGFLYGGTGIAVCAAAAEAVSRRQVAWITTQYVANAFPGEVVDLEVVEAVRGAATSQTQVRGVVDDRLIFVSTAAHSDRPADEVRSWGTMPDVSLPDESEMLVMRHVPSSDSSLLDNVARRIAPETRTGPNDGHLFVWTRVHGWPIGSAASQGFVADLVPMCMSLALGREMGGTSLDNTVRIVSDDPVDDWVLLDIEAEGFGRGIGHGRVRIWRTGGALIGIASQSAIIRTSHHNRPRRATTVEGADRSGGMVGSGPTL